MKGYTSSTHAKQTLQPLLHKHDIQTIFVGMGEPVKAQDFARKLKLDLDEYPLYVDTDSNDVSSQEG